MLGFNIIFDAYVKCYAPSCLPLAYVDNLQLIGSLASSLQQGILVVEEFMSAWDLDLDPAKSYCWPTDSKQRSVLRSFSHHVRLHARDLGAQLAYCAKTSRSVFQKRLESVSHVWSLLRHSSAAGWFRRHAILVAIWPRWAWVSLSEVTAASACLPSVGIGQVPAQSSVGL